MIGEAIDGWQALQAARLLGPDIDCRHGQAGPQQRASRS